MGLRLTEQRCQVVTVGRAQGQGEWLHMGMNIHQPHAEKGLRVL